MRTLESQEGRTGLSLVCAVMLLFTAFSGPPAGAATYYVDGTCGDDACTGLTPDCETADGPKRTIQAAINVASDGDTIIVADGTYDDYGDINLSFDGKQITLRSANGAANCTISAAAFGGARCIYFDGDETTTSVVQGFTLTGATPATGGAAIHCSGGSSPKIVACVIIGNSTGGSGGGIYGSPVVEDCTISGNTAQNNGGGICGNAIVRGCTIEGNTATAGSGGGIYCAGGAPRIERCRIVGNESGANGGGVACVGASPLIVSCLIAGNEAATYGGGVYDAPSTTSVVNLTNCTIAYNDAGGDGGGVYASVRGPIVRNCIVWANTAPAGTHPGVRVDYTVSGQNQPLKVSPLTSPGLSYCDVQEGHIGHGNLNADPLFVDPDGADNILDTWDDNDLRLSSSSPCFDRGEIAGEQLLVPMFLDVTDDDGTTTTLVVGRIETYAVGDEIEYDEDGDLRTVTGVNVGSSTVTFTPALATSSKKWLVVRNYGPAPHWDLDGTTTSPSDRVKQCRVDMGAYESDYYWDCNSGTNSGSDACDIRPGGGSRDCLRNGIPDECEQPMVFNSPRLFPIGYKNAVEYAQTYRIFEPPEAMSGVTVTFTARADLGDANETIDVLLNGTLVGTIFDGTSGADCPDPNDPPSTDEIEIDMEDFNLLVQGRDAVFTLVPTATVEWCDPNDPYAQYISAEVQYVPPDTANDPCHTPRILPWMELNYWPFYQYTSPSIEYWRRLTDTVVIATGKGDVVDPNDPSNPKTPLHRLLRERWPDTHFIPCLKTWEYLTDPNDPYNMETIVLDDPNDWIDIGQKAARLLKDTGQSIILLDNEISTDRYHAGADDIDFGVMRQCLEFFLAQLPDPDNTMVIWYPTLLNYWPPWSGSAPRRYALCALVEETLPTCRMTWFGSGGPAWMNDDPWYWWSLDVLEAKSPVPLVWFLGQGYWSPQDVVEAIDRVAGRPDVFFYPNTAYSYSWVAGEIPKWLYGCLGDMNCDGELTFEDLSLLALAVFDPAEFLSEYPGRHLMNADFDNDRLLGPNDICEFSNYLWSNPGGVVCPGATWQSPYCDPNSR